eukprot:snap_masked-scaffold_21-processed-gene-1.15-mRNA-1 protein AED:0.00 eAED:0.00 QI:0/-1/0/1/-1/1/1/0/270
MSTRMPAMFVGHGSPMNAIEDNKYTKEWEKLPNVLPQKPRVILCISAHWTTKKQTYVHASETPRTIYDFGGFPSKLSQVVYGAHGNPEFAKMLSEQFKKYGKDGIKIKETSSWGLDHGCWSVLNKMFPEADIPVVQLSLNMDAPAKYHFELGKQLSYLREEGVLILGSGNIVHNLMLVDFSSMSSGGKPYGYDWAEEARDMFNQGLLNKEYSKLLDEKKWNQGMKIATNSREHYLPAVYILGARHEEDEVTLINDECLAGSLSMTSFVLS